MADVAEDEGLIDEGQDVAPEEEGIESEVEDAEPDLTEEPEGSVFDEMTPEERAAWTQLAKDARTQNVSADQVRSDAIFGGQQRTTQEEKMFAEHDGKEEGSDGSKEDDEDSGADEFVTRAEIDERERRRANEETDRRQLEAYGVTDRVAAIALKEAVDGLMRRAAKGIGRETVWKEVAKSFGLNAAEAADTDKKIGRAVERSKTRTVGHGRASSAPAKRQVEDSFLDANHLERQLKKAGA